MFETIAPAPPDAILGLTEAFRQDPRPNKINLGAGVFKDEHGVTPILASVQAAEAAVLAAAKTKAYLPIAGEPGYRRLVQEMILGAGHPALLANRVRTAQTPGGTAALRVGADLLKKLRPQAAVWLSRPTWANHRGVFSSAGFTVREYPYYNPADHSLDFDGLQTALRAVPSDDIVVLHACCHNPTGVDLSAEQWAEVAALAARRAWLPFVDCAYQGYGDGLEADRLGLLALAQACPEMLIASSFSKNFGLYQDRAGALTLVASGTADADAVFSNVEIVIRVNYSNPPAHGGLLVAHILADPALCRQWHGELDSMRARIADARQRLAAALRAHHVPGDFAFIARQKGLFSLSGLGAAQVRFLREQKGIYIVADGRINVAGITSANLAYLCQSIAEALI